MTAIQTRDRNASLIIPILNEIEYLPTFLSSLEGLRVYEIIIVDAGSTDGSWPFLLAWCREPSQSQRIVLQSIRGRGQQMNAGALKASGERLIFLHVDTQLPPNAIECIETSLQDPEILGGAFRLHIDSEHPFLRLVNFVANLRGSYLNLPYGDQVLFVRRPIFDKMGGYAAIPLMEDVDFVQRLKKEGAITLLPIAASTSARRWQKKGIYTTSIRNMFLLFLYFLGVSPHRLAKWYYPESPVKNTSN